MLHAVHNNDELQTATELAGAKQVRADVNAVQLRRPIVKTSVHNQGRFTHHSAGLLNLRALVWVKK